MAEGEGRRDMSGGRSRDPLTSSRGNIVQPDSGPVIRSVRAFFVLRRREIGFRCVVVSGGASWERVEVSEEKCRTRFGAHDAPP